MCGICGIFNPEQSIARDTLQAMNDTLIHRGPDGEGFFVTEQMGMGHRRLSIIDIDGGKQPIFNENKSIVITCNGEIYNHHELRKNLQQKGHVFRSNSDSEVIVHLYEELGTSCLKELQGMFAFAIWNEKKQELFLARDRIGIKPLVYSCIGHSIYFASEIKALIAAGVSREISSQAISLYFSLGFIPAPYSIYSEIHKLQPGHFLIANKTGHSIQKYWDLQDTPSTSKNLLELQQSTFSQLQRAVYDRLESEVPLGSFLSGGIDSSSIVATASQKKKIKTFTVGFNEEKYNESIYAQRVAENYSTDHHEKKIKPPTKDQIEAILKYFDEPFADPSIFPTFLVCSEAKKHITVALSGDGGDENFAGYDRYYTDALENKIRSYIPRWIRLYILPICSYLYPKADWLPRIFRLKTALHNISLSPNKAHFESISRVSSNIKKKILYQQYRHKTDINFFEQYYNKINKNDTLKQALYTDIKVYLPDDILTKVDICSMANSLEVRVPMLDHKFVTHAFQIPTQVKLKGSEGKYILKKTMKKWLDNDILYRKKMGFCIPLDEWLMNDFSELFAQLVLNGNLAYFDYKAINKLYKKHLKGISNQENLLWSLFIFHLWYKNNEKY